MRDLFTTQYIIDIEYFKENNKTARIDEYDYLFNS